MTDAMAVPPSTPGPPAPGPPAAGHRLRSRTADWIIEAWGPNRASCVIEALSALVESFAEVPDAAATRLLPLNAAPGGPEDALTSLLEDVISGVDVFSVVPVRFHLGETEGGGISGDMEVVSADQAHVIGPVPKAVSYHELSMAPVDGGWRCRVLIDV